MTSPSLPKSYASVADIGKSDFIEKKSRFLGFSCSVNSEHEARDFIKSIHDKYPDCSAVLYGYICGYSGNIQKFHDSHEPQGGMAILDSIKKRGLTNTIAVVVRYYGGIHLGAGPLGRAFGRAASLAIDNAKPGIYYMSLQLEISIDYSYIGKVEYYILGTDYKILSKEFSTDVELILHIPKTDYDKVVGRLKDITADNILINIKKEIYSPWDMKGRENG